jgi:uncharacterized protein (TIGR00299 family) protein
MKRDRILYFDCFSGLSGDMTLAGLVGLGLPEDYLRAELAKLGLPGWTLRLSPGSKHGIRGLRADVELEPEGEARHSILLRLGRPHGHRSHADIRRLLEDAPIAEGARRRALAIFRRLAEAEGRVHGVEADKVEFHEVGAVDSIIDIVGAAIGLDYLAPDRILCSRIELGGGFVKCQHGLLPVPAPAVVELLRGIPVKSGAVPFETTTPTGAAILAAVVDEFTDDLPFEILKVAYGIGHRDMDIPNALRLYLGEGHPARPAPAADERAPSAAAGRRGMEEGMVLECNVDDMSPELHGYLFERLLGAGAQDVWLTPIHMKKSRPAVTVSVLCSAADEAKLIDLLISETSTFGLRRYRVDKLPLPRETSEVETSLGKVRVKTAFVDGKPAKWKPEFEDLRAIALKTGLPLREVQQSVLAEIGVSIGGKR